MSFPKVILPLQAFTNAILLTFVQHFTRFQLRALHDQQAFTNAILLTFVQYFTRFQLTAHSRGPSATAGLLVFIGEVALGYCGRRIIVTPFVNQQFSLQVVERGRAVQFVAVSYTHLTLPTKRIV